MAPRLTFVVLTALAAVALGGQTGPRIVVTLLAHEGFLVRVGDKAVMFDGFLARGRDADDSLVDRTWQRMGSGQAPVGQVNLALVSHEHRDHFDCEVATAFLKAHPECVFPAPPAVYEALKAAPEFAAVSGRVTELAWQGKPGVAVEPAGIPVQAYRYAHEAPEFYSLDLGVYLVTLNGVRVLHAADADPTPARLAALHLEKEKLDVAFLAYSFFQHPNAGQVFAEHLAAKRVVVMHLPLTGQKEARAAVSKVVPGAIFFTQQLETQRL